MPVIIDDALLNDDGSENTGNSADTGAGNTTADIAALNPTIATATTLKKITPRWFSKELNGNGRTVKGRLSSTLGPANPNLDFTPDAERITRKTTVRNDKVTIHYLPTDATYAGAELAVANLMMTAGRRSPHVDAVCDPITTTAITANATSTTATAVVPGLIRALPDNLDAALLLVHPNDTDNDTGLWLTMTPHVVTIRSEESVTVDGEKTTDHGTHVIYRTLLFTSDSDSHVIDPNDDSVTLDTGALTHALTYTEPTGHYRSRSARRAILNYTYDPMGWVTGLDESYLRDVLNTAVAGTLRRTDEDLITQWFEDYSVYDQLCAQAELMSSDAVCEGIISLINAFFHELAPLHAQHRPGYSTEENLAIQKLAVQMHYLESYGISLEGYRRIFLALNAHQDDHPELVKSLVSQNMQLALNSNLNTLAEVRPQLPTVVADPSRPYPMPDYYSSQQRAAITEDAPLTIVSSGAGTGKSTVILERIQYIQHCGYDPAAITVLSFTNAAANNIAEKNPAIRSRTFAAQLNEIYEHNYPTHQLSNLDTIVNSIEIYYADELAHNDPVVTALRRLLRDLAKPNNEARAALTKLNNFIEYNQQACLAIFDRIKQISLELQIIICYQLIDQLVEPFAPPQHLIVDEVQDTSIFEFVYILRYVAKHRASLYIVGDASQTLYEFRAANPKALNSLEASGIFAVNRLTTNYRSNQEILDFANVHLSDIEANEYAKIQLRANNLDPVTAASMQEKVQVMHHSSANVKTKLADELPGVLMERPVQDYMDACLARGEKIAFLAGTRREANVINQTLMSMYPNKQVLSLVSDRVNYNALFSKYVNQYWDEVTSVPVGNAPFTFTTQVITHLRKLVPSGTQAKSDRVLAQAQKTVQDWWLESANNVTGMVNAVNAGVMTADEFHTRLRDNILQYEIRINNTKQHLIGERNRARKEEAAGNADMFTSTIHGVKGLEFDNVVLVHKPNDREDEADKRLYYVALTRAKKSEFIIAVGKQTLPRLVTDYEVLIKELQDQEDAAASAALLAQAAQGAPGTPAGTDVSAADTGGGDDGDTSALVAGDTASGDTASGDTASGGTASEDTVAADTTAGPSAPADAGFAAAPVYSTETESDTPAPANGFAAALAHLNLSDPLDHEGADSDVSDSASTAGTTR